MIFHTGLHEKALGNRREWLKSVLSHLTGGSLREKALVDRREGRNVLQQLTVREVTWRSSGVAECFATLDCARRHLTIVGSG